jgi:hypothetical protein
MQLLVTMVTNSRQSTRCINVQYVEGEERAILLLVYRVYSATADNIVKDMWNGEYCLYKVLLVGDCVRRRPLRLIRKHVGR